MVGYTLPAIVATAVAGVVTHVLQAGFLTLRYGEPAWSLEQTAPLGGAAAAAGLLAVPVGSDGRLDPAGVGVATLVAVVVAAAALTDVRCHKIPTPLLGWSGVGAVAVFVMAGVWENLVLGVAMGMVVYALLLALHAFGGIGRGDVRLVAFLVFALSFFGPPGTLVALAAVCLSFLGNALVRTAGIVAGCWGRRHVLPHAPFVLLAVTAVVPAATRT